MKHSTSKPVSIPKASLPFPMPEPQRAQALHILIMEARAAKVPPAMLVTHLPQGQDRPYMAIRVRVMRRIHAEVPGVGVRMLARAFRRDAHRVRECLKNAQGEAQPPAKNL
jgi:hypothetical protein